MRDIDKGNDRRRWPERTLLGALDADDERTMLNAGQRRTYADGAFLIRQGEPPGHAYLIVGGMVKVMLRDSGGATALLGIRLAGDLVGEMSVLEPAPRFADVRASGPVRAVVIRSGVLRDLAARIPAIGLGIAGMMARRLRFAGQRWLDFAARRPRARVAKVLDTLIEDYGVRDGVRWRLAVRLTQLELASLAGVSLSAVEKEIRRLASDGVLRWGHRSVEIDDKLALQEIAEI